METRTITEMRESLKVIKRAVQWLCMRALCMLHDTDFYKLFSLQAGQPREISTVSEVCSEPEQEWRVC